MSSILKNLIEKYISIINDDTENAIFQAMSMFELLFHPRKNNSKDNKINTEEMSDLINVFLKGLPAGKIIVHVPNKMPRIYSKLNKEILTNIYSARNGHIHSDPC